MELSKQTVRRCLLIVIVTLLLYWGLTQTDQLLSLLSGALSVLSPCILGFCLAFIINIALRPLESLWLRLWRKRRWRWLLRAKRPVCLIVSLAIVLGVIFAVLFIVLPRFQETLTSFVGMIPTYVEQLSGWWEQLCSFAAEHGVTLPEITLDLDALTLRLTNYLTDNGQMFVNTAVTVTTSIFSWLVDLVVAFVFAVYMLAQKEKLCGQMKKAVIALLPERAANRTLSLASLVNRTFTSFVTGQLTEACILGVLCCIGMLIFGMPYAPVISVLIGFTALIPIFGAFIGAAIGAFLILLISPIQALGFLIFIVVLQQLEGNLIYPRVVGKSVGLPGIWVLAAVTIGGGLFGVFGMLLSVPICSIAYTLIRELINRRLAARK